MRELRTVGIVGLAIFAVGVGAVFIHTSSTSQPLTIPEAEKNSTINSADDVLHTTSAVVSPGIEATTSTTAVFESTSTNKTVIPEKDTSKSVEEPAYEYDTAQAMVSTEGWKTCRNEWSGWEIQYPPDWQTYGHRAGVKPSDCTGSMVTFANWTPEEAENEKNLHAKRPYFFLSANKDNTTRRTGPIDIQNYLDDGALENERDADLVGVYGVDGIEVGIIHNDGNVGFVQSVGTKQIDLQSFSIDRDLLVTIFSTFRFVNTDDTEEMLAKGLQQPTTHTDTTLWKTCRNEWYGWEFRFPADWHIYEDGNGLLPGTCHGSYDYMGEWEPGSLETIYYNSYSPSVSVTSGDSVWKRQRLDAYPNAEALMASLTQNRTTRTEGYYTVDGHTFAWLTGTHGGLYVWHEGQVVKLSSTQIDNALLETILSTFRFFEPSTPAPNPSALKAISPKKVVSDQGWQICHNTEYGYQFKIPREWNMFADDPYTIVPDCTGPVVQVSNYKLAQVHNNTQPTVIRLHVEEDTPGTLEKYWAIVAQGADAPTYTLYRLDNTDAIRGVSHNFKNLGRYREFWDIVLYKGDFKYTFSITFTPNEENKATIETILESFAFK